MNYFAMVLLMLSIGAFLGIIRYIIAERNQKGISYGKLLTDIILAKGYLKTSMPNEFPEYAGELEDRDTQEYLEFISPDILQLIK